MSCAVIRDIAGVDRDGYEKVRAALRIDADPPAGLIVHAAGVSDGALRIIELWESEAAYERYLHERLQPTVAGALGSSGGQRRGSDTRLALINLQLFNTPVPT